MCSMRTVQYNVLAAHVAGARGLVVTGAHKHIVWDAAADMPFFSSTTVRVKITADDGTQPPIITGLYIVIDVSAGPNAANYPVAEVASHEPVLSNEYKTAQDSGRQFCDGLADR